MRALACGAYLVAVIAALIALLFAPRGLYTLETVQYDDIASWSLKGRGISYLPEQMRGVWFLEGNQEPTECEPEIRNNKTLCGTAGYKRHSFIMLDSSFCSLNPLTSAVTCDCALGGVFHQGWGSKMPWLFAISRPYYVIEKNDAEFAPRPKELFEGAMHLYLLGLSSKIWAWLLKKPWYRVTMHAMDTSGARIKRLTWWGTEEKPIDGYEPQPHSDADHKWTYVMKRVIDGKGNVDWGVVKELKRLFGPSGYLLVPRFGS